MPADPPEKPLKLIPQMRRALRLGHYSPWTERTYIRWVIRFVRASGMRHPAELGEEDVTRFLSELAEVRRVSASTQTQALSAILFLYQKVLGTELPWLDRLVRAPKRSRLPVVLSR